MTDSGSNTIVVLGNNIDHLILMKPVCDVLKSQGFEIVYIAADKWTSTFGFVDRLGFEPVRSILREGVIFDKELWHGNVLSHLEEHKAAWVFWWNGSTFPARNWKSSIKSAYRTLFFEVGFFPQREHLFVDSEGVNCLSSFVARPRTDLEDSQVSDIEEFIKSYLGYRRIDPGPSNGFIFVPLQLENDTQIELHSPWFRSMQQFIEYICSSFQGREIVIKPHPLDNRRYLLPADNSVRLVENVDLYDFISRCSAVVGINSTVCTEALLFGKPVATCGYGIFSNSGVTMECVEDLDAVKYVTSFRPDPVKIRKYLFDLVFRGQIRVGSVRGTVVTSELRETSQLCQNRFLSLVLASKNEAATAGDDCFTRSRAIHSRLWMPIALSLYKFGMKWGAYDE